jgi:hypothetical protein
MYLPHWLQRFFKDANRWQRTGKARRNREWDSPSLGVMRLEKRRVLNAAPVPVEPPVASADPGIVANQTLILEVDASQAANDNQADVFKISRQDDRIDVFANGSLVASELASRIGRIDIFGSRDVDMLILDFSGGNPLVAGGIFFHTGTTAEGMADSLVLQGGFADTVTHEVSAPGNGRISIDGF